MKPLLYKKTVGVSNNGRNSMLKLSKFLGGHLEYFVKFWLVDDKQSPPLANQLETLPVTLGFVFSW